MIVVVEGISACGKSTWCSRHGQGQVIAENGRFDHVPDPRENPDAAATFWAERNADRWRAALALEQASSWVICDTDPLKLHYIWCLWQIGKARKQDWQLQLAATRDTFAQGRIGFADAYVVGQIDPALARQQALADLTRRRSKFELHVRLQPALLKWYSALDRVLPGRVQFGFPEARPSVENQNERYSLQAFDRLIALLA